MVGCPLELAFFTKDAAPVDANIILPELVEKEVYDPTVFYVVAVIAPCRYEK